MARTHRIPAPNLTYQTATDFFERQRRARRQAIWLRVVFAFALMLASVVVAVGVVLLVCSAWTAWRLRDGGAALARSLSAVPVPDNTTDPRYRMLLNVIGEMAIASGVPQPAAWVLERESGINAFAAGKTVERSVIGVTAGALDALDRDELQAVIAHEFSHIHNGDMALNTRLIAWLSGLFAIERLARALKADERNPESARRMLLWWVALAFWLSHACGYLGLFIGRVLQAAITRRREEQADALTLICSLVAQCSGDRAEAAYRAGMNGLLPAPGRPPFTRETIAAAGIDTALEVLMRLPPMRRDALCAALLRIVAANGTMSVAEFDLLRFVSVSLGVVAPATGLFPLEAASA